MVLERFNKMLQKPITETKGSHWRLLHCGRNFRVEGLSASQHALLVHEGPPPSDFVGHDEFSKDVLIPVVDMSLFDDADTVKKKKNVEHMVEACQDWGYFFLVNHGVDLALMQKVEEQAYEFFSMSEVEKAKHSSQYSLLEKVKRWSEGVTIKPTETNLDEYDNQLSPPEDNHQFSTIVKEYDAVMKTLAMRIVKLLAEGLGVKAWRFAEFLEGMEATLRWNFQPPCPRPENAMGLCPHSDPYLLTLQHDSGIGGLQIQRKGKWLGIPPRPDALIVNVGDVFEWWVISFLSSLELALRSTNHDNNASTSHLGNLPHVPRLCNFRTKILTNGRFKSTSHRTVVNKVEGRLSVAHCLAPNKFATLIPPPEILKFGANLYKARTYVEYLAARKRLDSCNSLEFMKLPTSI